ncbi:MAG: cytochrome c biogenesis CcdA family protein [Pseudomonadota bacterium]|nr:cytochrome c biogenesis CcdA family protein [Pseudomonadota bacterium]
MSLLTLWLAGVLIAFSPCILPALPLIVAASIQRHPLGPIMMALGLIIGFVVMGTGLYILSQWLSLPSYQWRLVAAGFFVIFGLMMLLPSWHGTWLSRLADKAHQLTGKADEMGMVGQVLIGSLLGIIWSPCVGPALGAIFVMVATQGSSLYAALCFAIFAFGASIPLLIISYGGRYWIMSSSHILKYSNQILGGLLLVLGLAVLFQIDLWIQSELLTILPESWLNVVTEY